MKTKRFEYKWVIAVLGFVMIFVGLGFFCLCGAALCFAEKKGTVMGAILAEKHGCIYVDFQDMFERYLKHRHSAYFAWDRVHPNEMGAMMMAKEFLKHCDFEYDR